jgi:hypothetical protein
MVLNIEYRNEIAKVKKNYTKEQIEFTSMPI